MRVPAALLHVEGQPVFALFRRALPMRLRRWIVGEVERGTKADPAWLGWRMCGAAALQGTDHACARHAIGLVRHSRCAFLARRSALSTGPVIKAGPSTWFHNQRRVTSAQASWMNARYMPTRCSLPVTRRRKACSQAFVGSMISDNRTLEVSSTLPSLSIATRARRATPQHSSVR